MDPKLTPVMKQYMEIKKRHQDDILFFRMGDFYEMFFDDAQSASKILNIALTSRQNDVPMCGVPYHAAESYIARLIKAGKKVAICEQMEAVPSSGTIVRRDVVRVITPGTLVEANLLQGDGNNFLGSVVLGRERIGLSFVDVSTGDFFITSMERSLDLFRGEMSRFAPREVVFHESEGNDDKRYLEYCMGRNLPVHRMSEWLYDPEYMEGVITGAYGLAGLKGLGITEPVEIAAAGAVLQYLKETHMQPPAHLKHPQRLSTGDRMFLDDATVTNLELAWNSQEGSKARTLFSVLNYTKTAMGRRSLEWLILNPMVDILQIETQLNSVQYFFQFHGLLSRVQQLLDGIYDIERLLGRVAVSKSNPKNFISIMQSLKAGSEIRDLLAGQPDEQIATLAGSIPDLSGLSSLIGTTIVDNPPLSPEQGRVIRDGFSAELDRLQGLKTNAKEWIVEYQEKEKTGLGIPSLKIRYNRVLGYYIEISKGQAGNVPGHYFRKQTLVGAERFTTSELQEFESEILTASDTIMEIEKREIAALADILLSKTKELQASARILGTIDLHCSLAMAAVEHGYVRPEFNEDGRIHILEGRHPVVEKYYTREVYVPNDIVLDGDENTIKIITGPNMSGKSTYIRMCAIIQLMSQIGSFVPAREAQVSVVDRIFTRIGASDNIARGESTFLVEMNETANILNNATERSLIIMDEVGRGTSTYDGLSIAWSIVEYIITYLKAKTLFATHYHELTKLGGRKGIANYTVLVKEGLHGVEFLYRVTRGAADKSYGIHVARLAGIPKPIVQKAESILSKLEKSQKGARAFDDAPKGADSGQLEIFNAQNHIALQFLRKIDTDSITPLEALNELNRLKKLLDS
jgi:DNA mismatch repair protein MutS